MIWRSYLGVVSQAPVEVSFYFIKIRSLSSSLGVTRVRFDHAQFADSLAKQGVNRSLDLEAVLL